ncbi:MAG: DUF3987 domain-containing protein [Thermoguttaceae bacterium]|nr:DUF3987 domain-containing protein [Thermoguttaceae bacterium]
MEEERRELFVAVSRYIGMGYRVIPCKERGKTPATRNGVNEATDNLNVFVNLTQSLEVLNVAIAGGNGLIIIDLDVKDDKDGVANLTRIAGDAGVSFSEDADVPFPQGWVVAKTPSGGRHLYFRCENSNDYSNSVGIKYQDKETGIDIRTDGGYVLAAPSAIKVNDHSVKTYEWVEGRELVPKDKLPELPKWLADILPKKQPATTGKPLEILNKPIVNTGISATDRMRRVYAYLDETEPAIEHQNGHTFLYTALGRASWGFDLNEDETRHAANYLNDTRCKPPVDPKALDHKIENVMTKWKNHQGKPRGHLWTESRRNGVPGGDAEFDRMIANLCANAAAKRKATSTQQVAAAMSENDDNSPLDIPFDELHPDDETFPLDAFPKVMQRYIRSVAESMNVPERMVALPLLVEMAGVIGSTKELEIYEGRYEKASLWGTYVAVPGEKKSPVLHEITSLIKDHETIARDEYDKAVYVYKVEKEKFDKAFKRDKVAIEDMPVAPKSSSILIGKSTTEALLDRIAHGTRGVLMVRDEMSGLLNSLNQYKNGKGDDLDTLLEVYDGNDVPLDTKSGGSVYIRDCTCSIFGGIQPQRFRTLFHTQVNIDSGFFARFIPLWIPEADSIIIGKPVDAKAKRDMVGAVDNLWLLEKTAYQRGAAVLYRPGRVPLDIQSRNIFLAEENFYQRMKKKAATDAVKTVLGKVASRSAKIAFIFAMVEFADILREMPTDDNKTYINKTDLHVTECRMKAAIRVNFWLAMEVYRWMTDSTEYEVEIGKVKALETEIILKLKSEDVRKRNLDREYKSVAGKQALRNLLDNHTITTVTKEWLTSRGVRGTVYYSLVTS